MPIDKDFKRLVRQRMAETGERFTQARAAVTNRPGSDDDLTTAPSNDVRRERLERWIELLGDPEQNQGVFRMLRELDEVELRPLAVAGTRHENPRVRRRSCQLLDDLPLTPDTVDALEGCAEDPDPDVRRAALHSLACAHCKPDGVCLDQRAIAERAASDRSAKVRRGVAMGLSWDTTRSDRWAIELATRLLEDRSPEIRRYASAALDRIERQRRTDEARRGLPESLRSKTDRHPGKWVAIENGDLVAVNPAPTWKRRHPDADLYFVTPEAAPVEGSGSGRDGGPPRHFVLRRVRTADDVRRLWAAIGRFMGTTFDDDRKLRRAIEELDERRPALLVIEADGSAVGGAIELSLLAIDPAVRGLGLGRRLVQTVEAELLAQNRELRLHANAHNKGFFERLGYVERGASHRHMEKGGPVSSRLRELRIERWRARAGDLDRGVLLSVDPTTNSVPPLPW